MSAEKQANATLSELLIQKVQELILENEEARLDIRTDTGGTPVKGTTQYDSYKAAAGRIKQLKRDLGVLLFKDEKLAKQFTKKLQKLDLIENPGKLGDTLSKFLKSIEGKEVYFKEVRGGTVGHHATATSILRDALTNPLKYDENKNIIRGQIINPKYSEQVTKELAEIARANGYELSGDALAYIDPAAHKEFTSQLQGILGKRLNFKNKAELEQFFDFQELLQRSAHARAFGGTQGIPLPPGLLTGKESAQELFKIAEPYLKLAKAGTIQGLNMDALLRNTDWSNPEDLLKVIRSAKVPNTDKILQEIYHSQVSAGITPSGRLIGAFTDPTYLRPEHRPAWHKLQNNINKLGNTAEAVDIDALKNTDYTGALDVPMAKGTPSSTKWKPQSIFHMDLGDFTPSGGGAAALVKNTALDLNLWKEVIEGIDPSRNPFGAGFAFGIDYTLDQRYRETINRIVTGKAEQGDIPYAAVKTGINTVTGAITEYGMKKAVIPAVKTAWGALPATVQSGIPLISQTAATAYSANELRKRSETAMKQFTKPLEKQGLSEKEITNKAMSPMGLLQVATSTIVPQEDEKDQDIKAAFNRQESLFSTNLYENTLGIEF
tara:strand:+ start:227 stop:2044 length:1818 start_codon:yes stop_codon:yes gene_type:complete